MKPNKKELMSSYQLPGDMAGKVLFLNPKRFLPGYVYGGYQTFMQESIELKLLCRDLHIDHDEAIRRLNECSVVAPPAEPEKPKKAPVKRFVKPTLNEVKQYCESRKNNVDPLSFINHYDVAGWMRGKTPIKDWKACVRTWEASSKDAVKKVDRLATPDRTAMKARRASTQAPLLQNDAIEGELL